MIILNQMNNVVLGKKGVASVLYFLQLQYKRVNNIN